MQFFFFFNESEERKGTTGKFKSVRFFCYGFESFICFIVYGRKSSDRLSQPFTGFTGYYSDIKERIVTSFTTET